MMFAGASQDFCSWTVDLKDFPPFCKHWATVGAPGYVPFKIGLELDSAEVRGKFNNKAVVLRDGNDLTSERRLMSQIEQVCCWMRRVPCGAQLVSHIPLRPSNWTRSTADHPLLFPLQRLSTWSRLAPRRGWWFVECWVLPHKRALRSRARP